MSDEETKLQDEAEVEQATEAVPEGDEPKNRRARRAAASQARKHRMRERREAEAVGLDAQEMLDDAFVRGTDSAAKWFRRNSGKLQWVLVLGIVGWAGWGIYGWRSAAAKERASDALAKAVSIERGEIGDPAEQGRPNEQDIIDPAPIFEDRQALLSAARAQFEQATALRPGSGTALYAELGLAAVLLDLEQFDQALQAYEEVKNAELSASEPELRGRALEGVALVAEAKGDAKAAVEAYAALEAADVDGFTDLAMYQQARLLAELGETAKARELVTKLQAKLGTAFANPMGMGASYLQSGVESLGDDLGVEPPRDDAPKAITPQQIEALQQQVQQQINQATQDLKTEQTNQPGQNAPDGDPAGDNGAPSEQPAPVEK